MNRDELWQYLLPMMEQNADYQKALQRIKDAEADYLTLLETMSSQQKEILERYIAACEAADDVLLHLACQIGQTFIA